MKDMNKSIMTALCAAVLCSACTMQGDFPQNPGTDSGYLSLKILSVDDELTVKSSVPAGGNYSIKIFEQESGSLAVSTNYSTVKKEGSIPLPAGNYRLDACSSGDDVPAAAFECPVYGVSKNFSIQAGQTTDIGSLVCTLLQTKVTVAYSDDFLKMVTGNGKTTVTVSPEMPLDFNMNYNGGEPVYDQSAGYFAVNNGSSTTMLVNFSGSVDGKDQKMRKVFTDIAPKTWHQIKFVKKVDEEGTASFDIVISDFIDDEDLLCNVDGKEEVIGEDPSKPTGDGGIKLESTCSFDITQPIVVPSADNPFILTLNAIVPNKVKKFTVEISSDNAVFEGAVRSVNNGSNVLDLVNPTESVKQLFTEVLPFPCGEQVANKDLIAFDLSDAQLPLLGFSGTHTFTMHVTDQKSCSKSISIVLVVNQ